MKDSILKSRIQERLSQRATERNFKLYSTPEYQKIGEKFLENLGFEYGKKDRELIPVIAPIIEEMKAKLKSPSYLSEVSSKNASSEYMTSGQFENVVVNHCKNLTMSGIMNEDEVFEFRKAHIGTVKFFENNDKLLSILVDIAKEKGIEESVSIESENLAIREIFPNPKDFIEFKMSGKKTLEKYISDLQKIMTKNDASQTVYGPFFSTLQNAMKEFDHVSDEVIVKDLEKRVQDIYGYRKTE